MPIASIPDELVDALRMARERGTRAILVHSSATAPALQFSRHEQWSEREPFAGAAVIAAYIAEAVIGPQELEQAVRDQVAAGLRGMGYVIDDEPVASHSATLTLDRATVAVQATRLADGALLLITTDWEDVPALKTLVRDPAELAAVERLLKLPHGLVIVTGPDARSRRALVRSIVRTLEPERCTLFYITDEDEAALPSVRHRPGGPGSRMGRMRDALRWDPDIVVLAPGAFEQPVCELLVNSAVTGHLTVVELAASDDAAVLEGFRATGVDASILAVALAGIACARGDGSVQVRIVDDVLRMQLTS